MPQPHGQDVTRHPSNSNVLVHPRTSVPSLPFTFSPCPALRGSVLGSSITSPLCPKTWYRQLAAPSCIEGGSVSKAPSILEPFSPVGTPASGSCFGQRAQ